MLDDRRKVAASSMQKHRQEVEVGASAAFVLHKVGDTSFPEKRQQRRRFDLNQTSCAAPGADGCRPDTLPLPPAQPVQHSRALPPSRYY